MNFSSQPLSIESFDGAWLAGTLELPANPFALAIPVHGSFPQTRDGNIDSMRTWIFPSPVPKRDLFLSLRDAVIPLGVGTYRYDKRASGSSEGVWADTDFIAIATDLVAVMTHLRRRFPHLRIGFVGQSEGCLTSLRASTLGVTPDFFISQGGALETYVSLIDRQKDKAAKPFLDDKTGKLEAANPYVAAFYREWFHGNLRQAAIEGDGLLYELKGANGYHARINLDLIRQYDEFDPMQVLADLNQPSLVMNGTADQNVPTSAIETIQKRQRESGEFPHVTCALLEGLEHSFRKHEPGETFLEVLNKPIDPSYAATIASFLTKLR